MRAAVFQTGMAGLAVGSAAAIPLTLQQGGDWWVLLPLALLAMSAVELAGSILRDGLFGGGR